MRPICSAVGTATYQLGKFVAKIIQPTAVSSYGTDLNDTFQFVSQLRDLDFQESIMASFDVQSLFTNVPLVETIDVCMDKLYRGNGNIPVPNLPEQVLRKLLSLCVCDNTFVFNGKVYSQIDGVAMGSSLGPVLANIWMCHLEEQYIFSNRDVTLPSFYRRYVDDAFCVFKNREEISAFHEFLNSLHVSTKFDFELESESKLSFLDTVVSRNPKSVSTKVKATDKGLFYDYNNFIPDRIQLHKVP